MKPMIAMSLLLAASVAHAEAPSPFLSAADRQEQLTQKREAEQARIEKLVKEAVESIRSGKKTQGSAEAQPQKDVSEYSSQNEYETFPKPGNTEKRGPSEPSDFAIAGIHSHHILIRQLNNKSLIVGSGEVFWDRGEAYEARIKGHDIVAIKRKSDGKIVFYGGVGSVFTPAKSSSDSNGRVRGSGPGGEEL